MCPLAKLATVLAPNAVSLCVQMLVPRRDGASKEGPCPATPRRPPGYVFAIVWPILYILLGVQLAFYTSDMAETGALVALVVFLNAWYVAFMTGACRPVAAFIAICGILAYCVALTQFVQRAPVLLVPLITWLSFATYISAELVQFSRANQVVQTPGSQTGAE